MNEIPTVACRNRLNVSILGPQEHSLGLRVLRRWSTRECYSRVIFSWVQNYARMYVSATLCIVWSIGSRFTDQRSEFVCFVHWPPVHSAEENIIMIGSHGVRWLAITWKVLKRPANTERNRAHVYMYCMFLTTCSLVKQLCYNKANPFSSSSPISTQSIQSIAQSGLLRRRRY